jgi:dipeptidase E
MRLLLISNSGNPFLDHCKDEISAFLGPVRSVAYVTAARLDDAEPRFQSARRALAAVGLVADHLEVDDFIIDRLHAARSVFVGGGNTYALLSRLRASRALDVLRDRVKGGLPYIGTSAGSNIAGPNILTTNDWNIVAATGFDAIGATPWNINPHYKESDPLMAAGSETRDQRIKEYMIINRKPVLALEEGAAVRVEGDVATIVGTARAKLFRPGAEPLWLQPGATVPNLSITL